MPSSVVMFAHFPVAHPLLSYPVIALTDHKIIDLNDRGYHILCLSIRQEQAHLGVSHKKCHTCKKIHRTGLRLLHYLKKIKNE